MDSVIRIWSIGYENSKMTLKLRSELRGHNKEINSIALSKDDNFIASSSADRTLKIFNPNSKECIHSINLLIPPMEIACEIKAIEFSSNYLYT